VAGADLEPKVKEVNMVPGPQEYAADTEASAPTEERVRVKVWDLPVRITHWLLVVSFAGAYITNSLGVAYFKYHEWFGYATIVLVAFRILWGLWGTYHARFRHFIKSPLETWLYAGKLLSRQDKPILGHNPLGALMVVLLLLTLIVQAITGLFANDEIFNSGALYGYVSNDLSLTLTALHKELFYWIATAIAVHILAVLLHVFVKNENLVSAMFTGYKSGPFLQLKAQQTPAAYSWDLWRALVLVLLTAAALVLIVSTAPDASFSSDY
jgi:cytochrome b